MRVGNPVRAPPSAMSTVEILKSAAEMLVTVVVIVVADQGALTREVSNQKDAAIGG